MFLHQERLKAEQIAGIRDCREIAVDQSIHADEPGPEREHPPLPCAKAASGGARYPDLDTVHPRREAPLGEKCLSTQCRPTSQGGRDRGIQMIGPIVVAGPAQPDMQGADIAPQPIARTEPW